MVSDFIRSKLNISSPEGWYKVTINMLHFLGAGGLLNKYNNCTSKLLANVYPEYPMSEKSIVNGTEYMLIMSI